MTLEVPVCEACGRGAFPPRLLCPGCGARAWRCEPVASGVLESAAQRGDVQVGAVRLALGPLVIVRLVSTAQPGDEVRLSVDGEVPVAGA